MAKEDFLGALRSKLSPKGSQRKQAGKVFWAEGTAGAKMQGKRTG